MKIKKLPSLFLLFFILSCTNRQNAEFSDTKDSSLAKIIVNNELVVGVDPSMPPLSFYAGTGKIIGYEVDIAQALADKLGVKLRLVPITSEDRIEQLEGRNIDYIASGFINNDKNTERFLLSTPYLRDALIVVVLENIAGASSLTTLSDLRNKRIGLLADQEIRDIVHQSVLNRNGSRQPYVYPRMEKLLIALDYEEIEAAVTNLLTYYSQITKEKKNYRAIGEPLTITTYSYAFRKKDTALHGAVEIFLNELAQDGTLRAIGVKWFGADVSIVGKY